MVTVCVCVRISGHVSLFNAFRTPSHLPIIQIKYRIWVVHYVFYCWYLSSIPLYSTTSSITYEDLISKYLCTVWDASSFHYFFAVSSPFEWMIHPDAMLTKKKLLSRFYLFFIVIHLYHLGNDSITNILLSIWESSLFQWLLILD